MSKRFSEEKKTKHSPVLRAIGFGLILTAVGMLSRDAYALCVTAHGAGFSGLGDVWQAFDKDSFMQLQNVVIASLSSSAWYSFVLPMMSVPLALLCGVPGMWMVRAYSPGIKVRPPTVLELQMISAGMNPRRHKR